MSRAVVGRIARYAPHWAMTSVAVSQPAEPHRPLEGRCIGISISPTDELPSFGLGGDAVNVVTVDLARRIIALGGSVILGHDWRTGGVMEAVARFAVSYAGQNAAPEKPLILNYLAEPDRRSLSSSDSKMIESIVECATFSWANSYDEILGQAGRLTKGSRAGAQGFHALADIAHGRGSEIAIARALNLTAMRYYIGQRSDIRILVGGKTLDYQGLAPGIIEEAWWQVVFGKPLIVCGGMGGASGALMEPDSAQAFDIQNDNSHPIARAYLEDIHSLAASDRSRIARLSDLRVDAILAALG